MAVSYLIEESVKVENGMCGAINSQYSPHFLIFKKSRVFKGLSIANFPTIFVTSYRTDLMSARSGVYAPVSDFAKFVPCAGENDLLRAFPKYPVTLQLRETIAFQKHSLIGFEMDYPNQTVNLRHVASVDR